MKSAIALMAITSLMFFVSCSNDASVSSLSGGLITEIVLDDNGNVVDEEPIEEEENIEDIVEDGEDSDDDDNGGGIVVDDPPVDDDGEEPPVDPPVCSVKKNLKIEKSDGSGLGNISSYHGYLSAAMNYNYYSASAHPIVGPHPEEYEGHFFFYDGKDGLALNFFYNIDAGGSSNNQVHMEVSVSGNDQVDRVLLSDDGHEVKKVSREDGANLYSGKMHYWYNTDGGVIGPLKGKDFKIHVKIFNIGDNKTVGFHSADGRTLSLETGVSSAEAYSEFVIYYDGEVEDCDSSEADHEKNMCIKQIADNYSEKIDAVEGWREEYRAALLDRKAQVKAMAAEQKAERKLIADEFKKAHAALRSAHKDLMKEVSASHRDQIKSCNSDREAKKSGECKAMAKRLRAERKQMHASHKSAAKEINAQKKAAIKAYRADAKAKRKALAKDLLKAAKALKKALRKAHSEVMESFQEDIRSCSAE